MQKWVIFSHGVTLFVTCRTPITTITRKITIKGCDMMLASTCTWLEYFLCHTRWDITLKRWNIATKKQRFRSDISAFRLLFRYPLSRVQTNDAQYLSLSVSWDVMELFCKILWLETSEIMFCTYSTTITLYYTCGVGIAHAKGVSQVRRRTPASS